MQYRRLGNSGLIVSALSLGTMQFGRKMNMGGLDQAATTEMIRFALDRGINFLDTADVYSLGESETQIGESLKELGIRQEIVLATKARLPMNESQINHSGATRVNILREVEASLRRLQTDYIDLYQMHGWDSTTPIEETLRTLDDVVRAGKVRYIGLSNYLAWQAATALAVQERYNLEKYVTAQMYYSLVGRDLEHDFMPFAEYSGIGILVWSPLAGGFLSGKYRRGTDPAAGTRFAEAGQFVMFDQERAWDVIDVLAKVAERHSASPARVSLAWMLTRPAISSIIIGGRRLEQLEDNIKAAELILSADDLKELNEVSDPGTPYPKWMVLQLDQAEDPRPRTIDPARFADGGPWQDLRFRKKK